MSRNFFSPYIKFFSFLIKILLLVVFCALFALLVVTPLWKFSTANPSLYSLAIASGVVLFIVFTAVKKIYTFYKTVPQDERKRRIHDVVRFMVLCLIILLSLSVCTGLVMNGYRFPGILSLLIGLIVYGTVSFVYKRK